MERKPQTYANHAKWDPIFHFFLAPLLLILAVGAIRYAVVDGSGFAWGIAGLAVAAMLSVFKMRLYSLKVQDRVIRMEERLRLSLLLPESLRPRIGELREAQLIALRFAPDAEAPALVQRILDGRLDGKAIKQAIKNWRPDYLRV